MTDGATVVRALADARRISYSSLLDRLRALGEEPSGIMLVLDALERRGVVHQLDRQGRRWSHVHERNRGPLYIEVQHLGVGMQHR